MARMIHSRGQTRTKHVVPTAQLATETKQNKRGGSSSRGVRRRECSAFQAATRAEQKTTATNPHRQATENQEKPSSKKRKKKQRKKKQRNKQTRRGGAPDAHTHPRTMHRPVVAPHTLPRSPHTQTRARVSSLAAITTHSNKLSTTTWSPPCRQFDPPLATTHTHAHTPTRALASGVHHAR